MSKLIKFEYSEADFLYEAFGRLHADSYDRTVDSVRAYLSADLSHSFASREELVKSVVYATLSAVVKQFNINEAVIDVPVAQDRMKFDNRHDDYIEISATRNIVLHLLANPEKLENTEGWTSKQALPEVIIPLIE